MGPSAPLPDTHHQQSLTPTWFFTLKCSAFAFGATPDQPSWCLWELGRILPVLHPLFLSAPLRADLDPSGDMV